eukprot:gnl/TRDRNA2_/TRDRNA2_190805_c0_seq1.p1 gnl/TRDRNA2_/TRDRNA2_190805_c0~~gnl/TRDRNA2_/TRDRNA2_190805_c0_seq1.p1  ORF type:complete len:407 (+),score=70.87 gnl/TRDRNA2_/TRDRNA2_190805_c0_seq1:41-1222(+)
MATSVEAATSVVGGGGPSSSPSSPPKPSKRRQDKFLAVLAPDSVDKQALAELTWSGVADGRLRCEVWQMLLGYRPLSKGRRADVLQRKRHEYVELRNNLYHASPAVAAAACGDMSNEESGEEHALLRQIRKDLPRTRLRSGTLCPAEFLVEHPLVQGLLERVLFVWAVHHPASGYVQGLNDVLLPLVLVFMSEKSGRPVERLDAEVVGSDGLTETELDEVEADCYWCSSKILSEIFDHYTHGQPGIQRMVLRLKEILMRVDEPLHLHLDANCIDLMHTAFRWITCLMVRELPVECCIRLWDTCIAESALATGRGAASGSAGFEALFVYFCACFTAYFSKRLLSMDFEAITIFLQKMPTDSFTEADVEVLLGEAYVLKSLFQQAPSHLQGTIQQ